MTNTSAVTGTSKNKIQTATLKQDIDDGLDREKMISVAAYYHAEQRGFSSGDHLADWLSAEAEIDAMHMSHKT